MEQSFFAVGQSNQGCECLIWYFDHGNWTNQNEGRGQDDFRLRDWPTLVRPFHRLDVPKFALKVTPLV